MFENELAFMKWIARWNRSYGTREEYAFRLKRWLEADAYIKEVNSDGTKSWTAGHNKFSDWTAHEYEELLTF